MEKHTVTIAERGNGEFVVSHLVENGQRQGKVMGSWREPTREKADAKANLIAELYGAVVFGPNDG